MQKKLIALAITAAFASAPAFAAETSVYGLVDGGFGSKAITPTSTNIKTTNSGIFYSQDQTTRFGIKSSEDLGNGMKAMFQVELGLSTGFGIQPSLHADRILTGGLDFGQGTSLNIGLMSTPFRGIVYGNDAMYGANFVGNLVTADSSLTSRHVAADVAHNFGAVTATFGLMDATTQVAGSPDAKAGNGFEATAVYKQDALSVSGGYRNTETTLPAASGAPLTSDIKTTDMILAANYDFGVAKVYGQFAQTKAEQSVGAATTDKKTYETFGANMPFTSTLAGYVELGTGKHDTGAATSPKYSAYAVGVHYDLSKATFAYAHVGSSKEDTVTKTDQYGVGLVHSF